MDDYTEFEILKNKIVRHILYTFYDVKDDMKKQLEEELEEIIVDYSRKSDERLTKYNKKKFDFSALTLGLIYSTKKKLDKYIDGLELYTKSKKNKELIGDLLEKTQSQFLDEDGMAFSDKIINENKDTVIKKAIDEIDTVKIGTAGSKNQNPTEFISEISTIVINSIKDLNNEKNNKVSDIIKSDVYEISYHRGARQTHWWGGMRYSLSGSYGYPSPDDIFYESSLQDNNCRHDEYCVRPESNPYYTENQLEEFKEQAERVYNYKGKQYKQYDLIQHARKQLKSINNDIMKLELSKKAKIENIKLENRIKLKKEAYNEFVRTFKDIL